MGFALGGVWVMGYCGPMGYGLQMPAHRVGGWIFLWDIRGYGLSQAWVMRVSTVPQCTIRWLASTPSSRLAIPTPLDLRLCVY
ncbi:hypothetical protein BDN70DRAFT_971769 [Pholiota conissans]|uniref:Uncharacterized protein n=1 Tax=Pholiota conissans TaxID=109636 RepID=A0A9P5Z7A8_9AGAR|nr:hypothetical protein BDN70DRAFT_971769 [Pholiota conissans]